MGNVVKQHDPSVKNINILGVFYRPKHLREIRTTNCCGCPQNWSKTFTVSVLEEEEDDDDNKEGTKKKKKTWKEVLNPREYHILSAKYVTTMCEEMILEEDMKKKMALSSTGSL